MKSYLGGNPELKLALSEDLVVGKTANSYGRLVLDDANFHECVDLTEFESGKVLSFIPPDGEFAVMNYRITNEFNPPFKITPSLEQVNGHRLEFNLKVFFVCLFVCESLCKKKESINPTL